MCWSAPETALTTSCSQALVDGASVVEAELGMAFRLGEEATTELRLASCEEEGGLGAARALAAGLLLMGRGAGR
eukprot:CAMPEP_0180521396 /NCGR_PEP_ID=MMETSP1036_2-20121128/56792_1 /TAXON_ID=632150 /ORGANISM="Azadinium spinosum, Strain 3D9" /LENGTH=73 /DNA_ID=CAMNT_0022533985 /DNA_START=156 /DNA_END=373 /DNA_ORIENTATION=-